MHTFSVAQRAEWLHLIAEQTFELIIIGGGITGAGIALDAAARGIKTLLVEKGDFAGGTSSRSTKLIHGGLRYLKQMEVGLVMETGREREVLHRNAPHLVVPEKMLLPLVKNGTYGTLATSFGLWVYDKLAGVKEDEQRIMLDKAQTEQQEPLLRTDILEGGGLYIEYRTDDARLTIEVIKQAVARGAICLNYLQADGFTYNKQGKINGVVLNDRLGNQSLTVHADVVVNAAGPWVDEVRAKDLTKPNTNKHLHLTKGVHIVVPYYRIPLRQSVYFDVPDGRMMFAIPRGHVVYLGTTDTSYYDSPDTPRATQEDVDYILSSVNNMFPTVQLSVKDVLSSWAGLRPLIHEEGKSPSELSRKDEIFVSEGGLISIAGGKLTGYRKMAARVCDRVAKWLHVHRGKQTLPAATDQISLCNNAFSGREAVENYTAQVATRLAQDGLEKSYAQFLVFNFGAATETILATFDRIKLQHPNVQVAMALAELDYCYRHEMVATLSDFLIRRTGRLYFHRRTVEPLVRPLALQLAAWQNLPTTVAEMWEADFLKTYQAAVEFLPAETHAVMVA
ncbi:MAG: glycerol-3-phosphate dehydrogenase/oxidase [Cytophagales bacterium]|nr:glycerol-3-phosphate dehydrogenase/oxidase [Bernardetiaceae bacterium]MDW8205984.1 glycerol-3-phosphate dehydrogenase/oxidase [Cytophagales bacterium]